LKSVPAAPFLGMQALPDRLLTAADAPAYLLPLPAACLAAFAASAAAGVPECAVVGGW
jgi:hypothetical protein